MSTDITIRDLIERMSEGPVVVVRGIAWNVAAIKQQTDHTDGSMRTQLKLTRQDPDGTPRRLAMDVELNDTVQLADPTA